MKPLSFFRPPTTSPSPKLGPICTTRDMSNFESISIYSPQRSSNPLHVSFYRTLYIRVFATKAETKKRKRRDRQRTELRSNRDIQQISSMIKTQISKNIKNSLPNAETRQFHKVNSIYRQHVLELLRQWVIGLTNTFDHNWATVKRNYVEWQLSQTCAWAWCRRLCPACLIIVTPCPTLSGPLIFGPAPSDLHCHRCPQPYKAHRHHLSRQSIVTNAYISRGHPKYSCCKSASCDKSIPPSPYHAHACL